MVPLSHRGHIILISGCSRYWTISNPPPNGTSTSGFHPKYKYKYTGWHSDRYVGTGAIEWRTCSCDFQIILTFITDYNGHIQLSFTYSTVYVMRENMELKTFALRKTSPQTSLTNNNAEIWILHIPTRHVSMKFTTNQSWWWKLDCGGGKRDPDNSKYVGLSKCMFWTFVDTNWGHMLMLPGGLFDAWLNGATVVTLADEPWGQNGGRG